MDNIQDIRQPMATTAQSTTPIAQPHHRTRTIAIIVVVLVGLLLAAFFLGRLGDSRVSIDEEGNTVHTAIKGTLIEGFPEELLLEQDITIRNSYATTQQNDAGTLPYVEYISRKSLFENVNGYRYLLVGNGWIITQDADEDATTNTGIMAHKDSSLANITFIVNPDGTVLVRVAYLIH